MIFSSKNGFIQLPSADLHDAEMPDVRVLSRRAMNGTRYTHKQTNNRLKFTFTYSHLDRKKMIELHTFLRTNKAERITLTDWDNQKYVGYFDDTTDAFSITHRANNGSTRNESGTITLTFIGE